MPSARRLIGEGGVIVIALLILAWAWRADFHWFERHTLPAYCARAHTQRSIVTIARALALGLAALLVVIVRPRVPRWSARWTLAGLARMAVAGLASLIVVDVWMHYHPMTDRTPLDRTDMPHAVADNRLGWRFLPSQTVRTQIRGRWIEYAIDARGNRAPSQQAPFDPDAPTLLIAGESIAFGQSLPWSESLPGTLAADLHVQVVTVGVPTYGLDQAYMTMRDALASLRHPIGVVMTLIPEEIRRTNVLSRPGLVLRGGKLIEHAAVDPLALSRLWRDEPYHDDTALELSRAVVIATANLSRQRGAVPLFAMTYYGAPCSEGGDAWIVGALLGGQPHVTVTLLPDEVIGAPDYHPNARGVRRLADAIEDALAYRPPP